MSVSVATDRGPGFSFFAQNLHLALRGLGLRTHYYIEVLPESELNAFGYALNSECGNRPDDLSGSSQANQMRRIERAFHFDMALPAR